MLVRILENDFSCRILTGIDRLMNMFILMNVSIGDKDLYKFSSNLNLYIFSDTALDRNSFLISGIFKCCKEVLIHGWVAKV